MGIVKLLVIAFISAFITMIMIYLIKRATLGKNIPIISTVAEGI